MNTDGADPAFRVVEQTVRESYGKLVAWLSVRTRDVALVEDVLSEAFVSALSTWPRDGVPDHPVAWLLTTARRKMLDRFRQARRTAVVDTTHLEQLPEIAVLSPELPDERLGLMLACAHPAIDSALHAPLMLQVVLGLDAARIARAFLMSPATVSQRLVRAKTKIRDAGIPLSIPDVEVLPQHISTVRDAIYIAYGTGWEATPGEMQTRGLATEAIWLARLLPQLLPTDAEARGLLSLLLFCESRSAARRSRTGQFVPLSEQDCGLWDQAMISEAQTVLAEAAAFRQPNRFQWEAAIQSVHADRCRTGTTEWPVILQFYGELIQAAPTIGNRVGHAAAVAEVHGPRRAIGMLDELESPLIQFYQPYWAVRAHLHHRLDENQSASEALTRAMALTDDPAVRHYLSELATGWAMPTQ